MHAAGVPPPSPLRPPLPPFSHPSCLFHHYPTLPAPPFLMCDSGLEESCAHSSALRKSPKSAGFASSST
eukprot:357115-Chlamydomonas_euryale.AAC.3